MLAGLFLILAIVFAVKWQIERIRLKAVIYYMVDKEYADPTERELEQCTKVVITKTIGDLFKNDKN